MQNVDSNLNGINNVFCWSILYKQIATNSTQDMIQTINFPFPKVFIVVCPDMSVMSINQSESLATMKRDTTIHSFIVIQKREKNFSS